MSAVADKPFLTRLEGVARRLQAMSVPARQAALRRMFAEGLDLGRLPILPRSQEPEATPAVPASHAQQRLWFLWNLDPQSSAYHSPSVVRLNGELDSGALQESFKALVSRHESLRTVFRSDEGGELLQLIQPSAAFDLPVIDLSSIAGTAQEELLQAEIKRAREEAFDLTTGPLLRVRLIHLSAAAHVLVTVTHHIVSDGQSMQIIIDEIVAGYAAYIERRQPQFPPLPIQYPDYALWQRSWLDAGALERQLAYWRHRLGTEHPVLQLPTDYPRSVDARYRTGRYSFSLPASLTARLLERARAHRATVFSVLLTAFNALLYRHTGQSDIRVGVPNANRGRPETQGIIGFFVNAQVLRSHVDGCMTLSELLEQVQAAVSGAQENQDLPFELLVDALRPKRSSAHQPLFQVLMNHQHEIPLSLARLPHLTLQQQASGEQHAQFELILNTLEQRDGGVVAEWTYARELFEPETIARLGRHYLNVLECLVDRPGGLVGEAPMLDAAESRQLQQWGASEPSSADTPVHRLFELHAGRHPSTVALIAGDRELTYGALNSHANRLAARLIASGVKPEVKVGVALERSFDLVVSVLAVLKAGGAYVPLDPEYPAQRLSYIMRDSGIALLLTQRSLAEALPPVEAITVLSVDALDLSAESTADPAVPLHPEHLAYVIYTSGSTGQPKGAQLCHRNVSRLLRTTDRWFQFNEQDVWTLFHSHAFDFSVWEIFGALCHGGCLIVVPFDVSRSPEDFLSLLRRHRVTVLNQTPSAFKQLMQAAELYSCNDLALRVVIFGGEALDPHSLRPWVDHFGDARPRLINMYGITETTVHVTYRPVLQWDLDRPGSPIGEPISDLGLRVLDSHLSPVPVGVAGELYVTGAGLARGYLNRAGLCAERFVADPFAAAGERMYRTGDQVRWSGARQLEYLGRIDSQVKVRGFRIEPAEIEAQLLARPEIREAIVVTGQGPGGMRLIAYVVPSQPEIDVRSVREHLANALPSYMVPAAIVPLERLPLSVHGKIDRGALPEPGDAPVGEFEAAQGALEEALARIWSEVLGVSRIGRHDNFFALGGDSISSLKVVMQARRQSLPLVPKQIFQHQTLSALAHALAASDAKGQNERSIAVADRNARLPASPAQSRQWFLWRLDEQSTAYHISAGLRLRGRLSVEAMYCAFARLIERHESLCTVFQVSAAGIVEQSIQAPRRLEIPLVDLSDAPVRSREAQAAQAASRISHTPFDLTVGPLLRAALIRLSIEEHVLVLVLHHIVSDGWSMQLIVNEIVELYRAHLEKRAANLPSLPLQYADYAVWQTDWLAAGERERQLEYWQTVLGDEHPVLQLMTDHPRPAEPKYQAGAHAFELPATLVRGLQLRAREHKATLFMVLLAGFQALLHRYTAQTDIRIGMTNANRNRPEIQGVVGFFVNTQILRGHIEGRMPLRDALDRARDAVVGAQKHQDLPFEQLVEALQPERYRSHQPLFQVLMDHQRRDAGGMDSLPELTVVSEPLGAQAALFELWMNSVEHEDGRVTAKLSYAVELFEPRTIQQLGRHYLQLLQVMVDDPERTIEEVRLLSEAESWQLLRWGAAGRAYQVTEPLHRMIERQAERWPVSTALVCGEAELSYTELNEAANRLAHRLVGLGVRAESKVGISMECSTEMIVGLLAILKAGGAYVPLDPAYPRERLRATLEDSGVALLLTHSAVAEQLEGSGITALRVDTLDLSAEPRTNPDRPVHPDHLAYVIYTSGSTGRAKGVQISHRNVCRLLAATDAWFHFDARDTWTMFHSYAFDFSVWEIFGALCHGGRLVLVPYAVSRSPEDFLSLLRQQRVTVLNQTPSAFKQLLQVPALYDCGDLALRAVIFGGEALEVQSLRPWFEHFGDERPRLINMYGITETTVHVTYRPVTRADLQQSRSPIGEQIVDLGLRVLDARLNLAPIGVPGELHVSGEGLARGYLNQAGLSAERFVADPFASQGERLYRTGDWVRWTVDGQLEYLGRIDSQVKIRGFRIELGEIQSQLLAQPEVREAVVLMRDRGDDKRLVAYIVMAGDALEILDADRPRESQEIVTQWESVFDNAYEAEAAAPSFRGWNSSYTDRPIPEIEMREWLQSTVQRIRSLSPNRILEIGCGVGLLVQRLAPATPDYLATDLSSRAVKDLRAWVATQPALCHVDVRQREARDFSGIEAGRYDLVVLNSVAQYFPGVDYFLEVLRGAANVVGAGGTVFIGDLRHLAHVPVFHTSVQLARASATLTVRQLQRRIDRAIAQDKELVLDPELFRALASELQMGGVDVLLKRGRFDNELTNYRYDVVLRRTAVVRPQPLPFDWTGGDVLERLCAHLGSSRPAVLSLRGVPNSRLARDFSAWRLVQSSDGNATVAAVLSQLDRIERTGVDPEDLWALGDEQSYDVNITWSSAGTDGSIDVEFIDRSPRHSFMPVSLEAVEPQKGWRSYASDPLRALRLQQLGASLRARLLSKLPDYMVPAHFSVLQALPLTANGKLDRRALPDPELASADRYEAPQGEMEQALAALWSEVLGVEHIGRHDDFFELGGHSLALIKVRSRLIERHGVELAVSSFFERRTLSELAAMITDHGERSGGQEQRLSRMGDFMRELEVSGHAE